MVLFYNVLSELTVKLRLIKHLEIELRKPKMLLYHTVFHKYQDNKIIENMSENTSTLLGDVKINQIHIEK